MILYLIDRRAHPLVAIDWSGVYYILIVWFDLSRWSMIGHVRTRNDATALVQTRLYTVYVKITIEKNTIDKNRVVKD